LGYSTALNQAVINSKNDFVCITGPDVYFDQDWLFPLVETYKTNPNLFFAVTSKIVTSDKREIQSEGSHLHFTGHLTINNMWKPYSEDTGENILPIEVGAIDSTSALIDRAKFLQIGGCDESFFVYHEEFDYCYRARMNGWKCWYAQNSIVYHGTGTKEFSVRSAGKYPSQRPYYHTRNRFICIIKNFQARPIIGIIPLMLLLELATNILYIRDGLFGTYSKVFKWTWINRKNILSNRNIIQSQRKICDKEILSCEPITVTPLIMNSTILLFVKKTLDQILSLYWKSMQNLLY
jgi:GT2 family glycosyltransferase